jgi:AcrR family transcriptional regulator
VISSQTQERILDSAWTLLVREGRLDVGMGAIAAAAGVSRQTLHLAFGGRTGLLVAMARRADQRSAAAERMRQAARADDDGVASFEAFISAWIEHLPEIYPVGVLLFAARETDAAARTAWEDRMESLRGLFTRILRRAEAAGRLRAGVSVAVASDLAWSMTHLDAWRHLVIERGWASDDFAATQIGILKRELFRRK